VFFRGFRGQYFYLFQVAGLRGIFRINNRPRHAFEIGAYINPQTATVKVLCQQFIYGALLLDFRFCERPVDRVTLNRSTGLAYSVNTLGRRKLEIKGKPRLPVGLKKPELTRGDVDPPIVHRRWSIKPGPVKHGMAVTKTLERYSKVHFPWSEGQNSATPPVILCKIDAAFLRPATELLNQAGLAAAWWSGDKDLAKAHTTGNGNALYPVNILTLDTIQ
jgi:hypothetical protein